MAQIKNFRIEPALKAAGVIAKRTIPARGALKLRRIIKCLAEAQRDVEETRQEIVLRFAEKDPETGEPKLTERDGGQVYTIPEDVREACAKELDDLYNDESELAHVLTIDDLSDEIEAELLLQLDAALSDEA